MIRGELGPEPLRHYKETVFVDLRYSEIQKDPFPTPEEAEVRFQLGKQDMYAFVPLFIVNEKKETVRAALVGEHSGMILVSFPPTNFGQTSFYAAEEDLEAIANSPTPKE